VNIIAFVISLALFIGGFFIMGWAFYASGFEAPVFVAGILCTSLGFVIPAHVLKRVDG
jgi:hypothetical protein